MAAGQAEAGSRSLLRSLYGRTISSRHLDPALAARQEAKSMHHGPARAEVDSAGTALEGLIIITRSGAGSPASVRRRHPHNILQWRGRRSPPRSLPHQTASSMSEISRHQVTPE